MGTKREKDSLAFLLNSGARLLNSAFERRISEAGLGLTPGEQQTVRHRRSPRNRTHDDLRLS